MPDWHSLSTKLRPLQPQPLPRTDPSPQRKLQVAHVERLLERDRATLVDLPGPVQLLGHCVCAPHTYGIDPRPREAFRRPLPTTTANPSPLSVFSAFATELYSNPVSSLSWHVVAGPLVISLTMIRTAAERLSAICPFVWKKWPGVNTGPKARQVSGRQGGEKPRRAKCHGIRWFEVVQVSRRSAQQKLPNLKIPNNVPPI
jgi:hypothetical protein